MAYFYIWKHATYLNILKRRFVSRIKHKGSQLQKINCLMFGEITTVYSENHAKLLKPLSQFAHKEVSIKMDTNVNITVFWSITLCDLVKDHSRFKNSCCLQHQGDTGSDNEDRKLNFGKLLPDYNTTQQIGRQSTSYLQP